jgi:predicted DNA-binding protein (MmcQ/YjbR family)
MPAVSNQKKDAEALRKFALCFPEATEDFPWGERVMKVRGKVFVFMGKPTGGGFGISAKLPNSGGAALMTPFASPTGYGLGKSGWVSASFEANEAIPLPILKGWIEESYRAVAPKTLVKSLDGAQVSAPAASKRTAPKKRAAPMKRAAARKVRNRSPGRAR